MGRKGQSQGPSVTSSFHAVPSWAVLLPETLGSHPHMPPVLLGTTLTSPDSRVARAPTVLMNSMCPALPAVMVLVPIAKVWPAGAHHSTRLEEA